MSKIFHKLRDLIEVIAIYAVMLPLGLFLWLHERGMRKLMGDDWVSGGEPSGRWDKEND